MDKTDLHILLGKQYLITAYIEPRIQIVNYIKDGYDNNLPVLINNRFLHFTAHNFYRSIIIDLAGLFSDNLRTHKHNFHQINKNCNYASLLTTEAGLQIEEWLDANLLNIEKIKNLRDKEVAHYDFEEKQAISLNFDNINLLNTLFDLSKSIIKKVGSSFIDENYKMGYDFERKSHYINSLEGLIVKHT